MLRHGATDATVDVEAINTFAAEFREKNRGKWLETERLGGFCLLMKREVLRRLDAAFVLADRRSRPITPLWFPATWTYVRMHQGRAAPRPCYGRTALRSWVDRIAGANDGYVYFNNDHRACAIANAVTFERMLERRRPAA